MESSCWKKLRFLHFMHNGAVPPGPNSPISISTASTSQPQPSYMTFFPSFAKSFVPLRAALSLVLCCEMLSTEYLRDTRAFQARAGRTQICELARGAELLARAEGQAGAELGRGRGGFAVPPPS